MKLKKNKFRELHLTLTIQKKMFHIW